MYRMLAVLLVLCCAFQVQAQCADDRFAPNDSCALSAPLAGSGLVDGLQLCGGTEDWFTINADPAVEVEISCAIIGGGFLDIILLELYTACGGQVQGIGASGPFPSPLVATGSSQYFIKASSLSSDDLSYELAIQIAGGPATPTPSPTPNLPSPCAADRFEENDVCADAVPLAAGSSPALSLCDADPDWHVITADPGETVTISGSTQGDQGIATLEAYEACDSFLPFALGSMGVQSNPLSLSGRDVYYLKVNPTFDQNITYTLDISIAVTPPTPTPGATGTPAGTPTPLPTATPLPCLPDLNEFNNFCFLATEVNDVALLSSLCNIDEDWYSYEADPDNNVSVTVIYDTRYGRIDLSIFDGCGGNLLAENTDNEGVKTVTVKGFDEYTIQAIGDGSNANAAYTIVVLEENRCFDDDLEPNDACGDAAPLERDVPRALTLCRNDVDWFSFASTADANVTFRVQYNPADAVPALEIFDGCGQQATLLASSASGAGFDLVTVTGSTDYRARIESADGNTTAYLVTAFSDECLDDFLEPNNDCAAAQLVGADLFAPGLTACPGETDWYRLPADPNREYTVSIQHSIFSGNVDLRAYAQCGGGALEESAGIFGFDEITLGGESEYLLEVFAPLDAISNYNLTIVEGPSLVTPTPTQPPSPTVTPSPTATPTPTPQPGQSYDYSFDAGWNMAAFPYRDFPLADLIAVLQQGNVPVEIVASWEDGGWQVGLPGAPSAGVVELGEGAFISVSAATDVTLSAGGPSILPLPSFQPGWNLHGGVNGLTVGQWIQDLSGQGVAVRYVAHFKAGSWRVHVAGLPFNDYALSDTEAYFLYAESVN